MIARTHLSVLVLVAALLSGCASSNRPAAARESAALPMSIHQEVIFKATPQRVYEVLTDAQQFAAMTGRPVAEISREAGGPFSCFGGIITGRQVELVPGQLIVEAWRDRAWDAGIYSIARFELKAEGSGTRLIFDHTGFPQDAGPHLTIGWKENYWTPLEKYLARSSP